MDWKALALGMALGALLLMSMGARKGSEAQPAETGRFELQIGKNAMGKDVWTIFDSAEGEARIFVEDTVRRVSYAENRVEELK